MNFAVLVIALLPFFGGSSSEQPPFPERISANGSELVLNGYGTRETWWVNIYTIGLYLPQQSSDLEYITQKDVPKSIWVKVTYGGSMPEKIPENWKEELFPALTGGAQRQLKSAYDSLSEGDMIRILYRPAEGTTLLVNGRKILSADHNLMEQFLEIWLGPGAVSENLKRLLLH